MAVTCQILTVFQNPYTTEKRIKFPTKPFLHHTLSMLPHSLGKLNSSNLLQIWKKMHTRVRHCTASGAVNTGFH